MRIIRVLAVAATVMLGAAPALADQTCVCASQYCGNNAVGGQQGDVWYGVTPEAAKNDFGMGRGDTGWNCNPPMVRGSGGPMGCYCAGMFGCGNGGIGGNLGWVDLGLSQAEVDQSYGGGMPGNRTGWVCRPARQN